MTLTPIALPQTAEIQSLLRIALSGTSFEISQITTAESCLQALDQARRPFPIDERLATVERRRLEAVLRLICLIGLANVSAGSGLSNKDAAELFQDFADGVPVSAARMDRHEVLSRFRLVEGGPKAGR